VPVKEIVVTPETYREAVDVVTSSSMKREHRKYGDIARKLAGVLKGILAEAGIPKGQWQGYWTVAARCLSLARAGHNLPVLRALAGSLAREMGLNPRVCDTIAIAVYEFADEILEGSKRRYQFSPVTRRGTRRR